MYEKEDNIMIENKKASILLVLKTLERYTDEEHYLTQQEIIDKIKANYGISLERKSIAYAVELLQELEYDINKGSRGGYALFSRNLDNAEVKFLIDAIFSSKVINGKQARLLADKLSNGLSIYQRKEYKYLYKTTDIARTNNNEVFYNIEIINEAMKQNKRIGFNYLQYDKDGKLVTRFHNYQYIVSPYYLVNNFGKYYLLCNYRSKYASIQIFRVDMMVNLEIKEDWEIKPLRSLEGMANFSISEYLNDHIYMLGGEVITAKLLIEEEFAVQYVMDWFSNNVTLSNEDGNIIATVKSNEQALIYWIMQYGEHIKLLGPSSLVDKLIATAHKSFDKYSK